MADTATTGKTVTGSWEPGALVLDGRFKVIELLGKGGVTEAWLAEHAHLGKRVALKVLRQDLGVGEGMGERFTAEARRLAAVDHRAVARVTDFGVSGPLLYLVTEVAEGKPLRALLKGEPLMPDKAVELVCQMAEGLAAIHEKGLLHRDLKPENIFVANTPEGDRVRLLDFGIARLVDPESNESRVTMMMRPVGLPQYMSPEQAHGQPTDFRSDLYSLGVVAYEMLSGRLPFDGPGPADYMLQHQEKPPRPLKEAAPHLVDNVRLCELVHRCLEKDPAKRPASAREVAQKLGRVPQVGEPTILMEALQLLPPALPLAPKKPAAAPAPAAAPVAVAAVAPPALPPPPQGIAAVAPAAKGPLLPSLVMPSPSQAELTAGTPLVPPYQPPKQAEPAKKLNPLAIAGLGAVAALALAGLVMSMRGSPASAARAALVDNKPADALVVLQEALKDKSNRGDPKLIAMLAVTMHQLDRHRDEQTIFREELAPKSPEILEPLVLGGLLEDLGKKEDGPSRELLKRIPKESLYPVVKKMAEDERSPRQWGALRYLDGEQSASELDLIKLYVAALETDQCPVRRVAAKRLGQLGDKFAEEALTKLKGLPKEGAEKACGQDEAAAALQLLAKKKE